MIVLTLPYPVSANRYWKAITIPGRTMMAPTREATAYKRDVARIAATAGLTTPLAGRLEVGIQLFPARPMDWQARQRKLGAAWDDNVRCIDLGNCEKVLADALQGIVYEDDRWIWSLQLQRMAPDDRGARVVVFIRRQPDRVQPRAEPAAQMEIAA